MGSWEDAAPAQKEKFKEGEKILADQAKYSSSSKKSQASREQSSTVTSKNFGSGSSKSSKSSKSSGSNKPSDDARKKQEAEQKAIAEARRRAEEALKRKIASLTEVAGSNYQSGLSQIENLIQTLDADYSAGKGRLDTQKERSAEDFGQEKMSDINRLRSFYNSIGIGDSEQAAQALERTGNTYSKRYQGLEEQYGNNLSDLESQRQKALAAYNNQKLNLGSTYRNTLSGIEADKYQGEADVAKEIAALNDAIEQRNLKERSLQLDELRTQYAINKPYTSGGSSSNGFTPTQQQNLVQDYQKDLQGLLDKYAFSPNGRELAYNELIGSYGNIFDPQSIQEDLYGTYAQDGWEQDRQSLLNNQQNQREAGLKALLNPLHGLQ